MSIDAVWLKFTAEQAQWFNEGVDTAKEILRQQEADVEAMSCRIDLGIKYLNDCLSYNTNYGKVASVDVDELTAILKGEIQP
jgi:hypothetical protein